MSLAAQELVELPEPFRSALAAHAPARVCDAEAPTPERPTPARPDPSDQQHLPGMG